MKKRLSSFLFAAMAIATTNAEAQSAKEPCKVQEINFEQVAKEEAKKSKNKEYSEWVWRSVGDECNWYCGGGPDTVTASSYLKQQGKNTYKGSNAHDFTFKTAWVEGVKGYGKGESLTYHFDSVAPRITKIIIANGYVKSNKAWNENSRVKTLKLYYNGKPVALLELKDIMGLQTFDFEKTPFGNERKETGEIVENAQIWTLRFEIVDVYPGSKYDDTAISEIYFDGLDVHCFVKGTRIQTDLKGTEKPIESLKAGDQVVTFENGTYKETTIKTMAKQEHTNFVTYTLENGETITCTPDHPLLLENGMWASADPKKSELYKGMENIHNIAVGDVLKSKKGKRITNITTKKETQDSYTIVTLANGKTFVANGVIVAAEDLK